MRRWEAMLGMLGTRDQSGQTFVEYGLIVMVIGVVMIASLMLLGNQVSNLYHNVSTGLVSR